MGFPSSPSFCVGMRRTAPPQYLWIVYPYAPKLQTGGLQNPRKNSAKSVFYRLLDPGNQPDRHLWSVEPAVPLASQKAAKRRRRLFSRRVVRASSSRLLFDRSKLSGPSRPRRGVATTSHGHPREAFRSGPRSAASGTQVIEITSTLNDSNVKSSSAPVQLSATVAVSKCVVFVSGASKTPLFMYSVLFWSVPAPPG